MRDIVVALVTGGGTTGLDVEQLIQKYARTTDAAVTPASLAEADGRPTTG